MRTMFILLILIEYANAKDIFYKQGEDITLPISNGGIVISFDADVNSITYSSQFKITPNKTEKKIDYSQMSIVPNSGQGREKITFQLSNRESITVLLDNIGNSDFIKIEKFYTFMRKVDFKDDEFQKDNKEAIRLISCMIKREYCKGYKSSTANTQIRDGIEDLWTTNRATYLGRNFNGYIFQIKNDSNEKYQIDYDLFTFSRPNKAVVSFITEKIIESRGIEYLYIVSTSNSSLKEFEINYKEVK